MWVGDQVKYSGEIYYALDHDPEYKLTALWNLAGFVVAPTNKVSFYTTARFPVHLLRRTFFRTYGCAWAKKYKKGGISI